MMHRDLQRADIVRSPKLTFLLAALVGAVQGSLLLNALPAILDSTARIIFQDSAYLLLIACVWKLGGANLKRWFLSPISATCVLFLSIDIIFQVFHGLTSGEFSQFAVFREARLLIYFLLTMICFGSVKYWAVRDPSAVALQVLFVFAGIGAIIYMILATQVVYSEDNLNFFASKQNAIDAGFGHAFHDKFKSPTIMVSFLSAYFMALIVSPISSRSFIGRPYSRALQLVALVGVIGISLSSNTRSLLVACLVGIAIPLITEAARLISIKRLRQRIFLRSVTLLILASALIFTSISILQNSDEKFTEQVLNKGFLVDQSDTGRINAVTRAATFDFTNPIGFGVGAGSNYVELTSAWMNPVDSVIFHAIVTLGYQFLIPYLVLHGIALVCAFSNSVHRSNDRLDFSLRSGLSAGLVTSLLSFYQASPLLFPADAMLTGAALGASISICRNRRSVNPRPLHKSQLPTASF